MSNRSREIIYNLTDFLSSHIINGWKRDIEIFNYNCGLVYLSFQLYQFLLHIFSVLLSGAYTLRIDILLRSSIILLIFCLVILSMVERGILKFSTITVGLSTFPFSSISFCFTYFQFFCLGHTHVELIYLLDTLIN